MTTPIVQAAIEKLAQQLSNLGCVYEIHHEGDVVYDCLPRQKPERTRKPRHDYESMGLYDAIKPMQAGDVVRVQVPDGFTKTGIQSVLAARLVGLFGKGNFMTQQVDGEEAVDVLRLS